MKKLTLLVLLIPFSLCAQNIKGIIYDEDSTVKGALIINLTQNDTTYSDIKGNFKLKAFVNDSIILKSLFHYDSSVKIKTSHYNDIFVFQLKKRINELGEVLLANEKKDTFKVKEYSSNLGLALANDMKNNPHLYMPQASFSGGINFGELAKLIGLKKLFKKKKNNKQIKYIKYDQIDSLFSNSKLFNERLLSQDLEIPKDYKYLFFDYCEAQNLNSELLSVKENVILLDSIFKFGNDFLNYIKEDDLLNLSGNK